MRTFTIVVASLALGGCLDHTLPDDGTSGVPETFIALQRDFAAFESWPAYDIGQSQVAGHPEGRHVVYLNRAPDGPSDTFPVGTMIVKTAESGPFTTWLVHAMVKRGGAYNLGGAPGWEWFELKLDEDRVPVLVWRGEAPPNGERYGCLSGDCSDAPDCNQCHAEAASNDYVKTSLLDLSGF